MTKTRVGVPSQIFFLWSGGIDLITRLSNALALDPDLEIVVLVASQGPDLNLRVPDGFKAKSGWLTEAKDKLLRATATFEIAQPALQNVLFDIEGGMPFLFIEQLFVNPVSEDGRKVRVVARVSGRWSGTN